MPFQCSICDEVSTRICVRCTKDACENHLCEKCLKCSDCCECEVALDATPRIAPTVHTPPAPESEVEVETDAAALAAPASSEEPELEAGPVLAPSSSGEPEPEAALLLAPSPSDEPEPDTAPAVETHAPDLPASDEIALPTIEGE